MLCQGLPRALRGCQGAQPVLSIQLEARGDPGVGGQGLRRLLPGSESLSQHSPESALQGRVSSDTDGSPTAAGLGCVPAAACVQA